MKIKYSLLTIILVPLLLMEPGCKKIIQVSPPPTSISDGDVYTSDATAIAVLTGLYAGISYSGPTNAGSISSLSIFPGLSADELTFWTGINNLQATSYYTNELTAVSAGYGSEFWLTIYPYIFSCNSAIDGLGTSSGITPAVKQQLLGEAKFMRAFFYFYLVNLYGDVPLALTTDYKTNAQLPRTPASEVYLQIISDLHDAQQLLSTNFLDGSLLMNSSERVRPTTWAATALLARVYLYTKNWAGADSAASVLINNTSLFALSALDSTFLRASLNNNEAIWQLQPVTTTPGPTNTQDAYAFIIPATGIGTGGNFGAYLSNNLVGSFELNDNRMNEWVGNITLSGTTYYYPYKYQNNSTDPTAPVTEFLMMLRLGEQYLIRAEAEANAGNISQSQADLNIIRRRAGLSGTTAASQQDLSAAILHERQVELFTELGQRWLDLKRTATVDATMSLVTPQKGGGTWNSFQQLYPVPLSDILLDDNLKQNAGY